ncbi:RNA methyltransferase, TrmH family [Parvimonas sp. oral taxon 110 str. F0139]|nr:RNA methyltransferase, TrmH family [Parvimonas sp. oral taxon 110 str. F0139]
MTELTNSEGVITVVNYIEDKNIFSKNIICLENVSDPGNFGTIVRTANAFGIKDILTINCVDKYNSKVLRATMGAMFRTNIVDCEIEKIKELQKDGYRLISTTLSENSKILEDFKFDGKNIVVMGNEANGVSAEMLRISNAHLKIDMDNSMESLNVSIAAAIIMYKIYKN